VQVALDAHAARDRERREQHQHERQGAVQRDRPQGRACDLRSRGDRERQGDEEAGLSRDLPLMVLPAPVRDERPQCNREEEAGERQD
jgi:hypothetical protein